MRNGEWPPRVHVFVPQSLHLPKTLSAQCPLEKYTTFSTKRCTTEHRWTHHNVVVRSSKVNVTMEWICSKQHFMACEHDSCNHQTYVIDALQDRHKSFTFWGQKLKGQGQGHGEITYAGNSNVWDSLSHSQSGGRVTAPIVSRKLIMRRGSVESM